jgi:hypothetical protein
MQEALGLHNSSPAMLLLLSTPICCYRTFAVVAVLLLVLCRHCGGSFQRVSGAKTTRLGEAGASCTSPSLQVL